MFPGIEERDNTDDWSKAVLFLISKKGKKYW